MSRSFVFPATVFVFGCAVLACTDSTPTPRTPPRSSAPVPIDAVLTWTDSVPLEENDAVINVTPMVKPDGSGNFVVADAGESQVRLYRPDGTLVRYFGSKGSGPEEFQHVSSALRLPSGDFLVTDMGGKVARFDSTARLLHTAQAPIGPLYGSAVINDSLVAFAGRARGQEPSALVHLWNLRTDAVIRSFFLEPPHREELSGAYRFSGFTDVQARGDTIAVLFGLSDTVYLYDLDGRETGKLKIPSKSFRPVREPMPQNASMEEFVRWTESFSAASQLFWEPDGSFLVQYFDVEGQEPQWRLVRMGRNGDHRFEVLDTPKLLAISRDTNPKLYFVHPSSPAPNVWAVARMGGR
jgi:WD40 repeat protein